ncbi:hypothetical protein [Fangia hongkongensis]|uniref:hypothetical protein n=1 Tax=Fangia hongkongensis TaxID=270495 RepID=UPI0003775FC9|nr:hypothetical protein [Fangia hongkongensis]MBK2124043.1 hypothetical protein [Fangia hongkongensis]
MLKTLNQYQKVQSKKRQQGMSILEFGLYSLGVMALIVIIFFAYGLVSRSTQANQFIMAYQNVQSSISQFISNDIQNNDTGVAFTEAQITTDANNGTLIPAIVGVLGNTVQATNITVEAMSTTLSGLTPAVTLPTGYEHGLVAAVVLDKAKMTKSLCMAMQTNFNKTADQLELIQSQWDDSTGCTAYVAVADTRITS